MRGFDVIMAIDGDCLATLMTNYNVASILSAMGDIVENQRQEAETPAQAARLQKQADSLWNLAETI